MGEKVWIDERALIMVGDAVTCLRTLPNEFVDCVVTSPPYWGMRNYNVDGQMGLEPDITGYFIKMARVFIEVKRILKRHGTVWLNLGDKYSAGACGTVGSAKQRSNRGTLFLRPATRHIPHKNLCGIPWRSALLLQKLGFILRQDIIWEKPSVMPESVTDRCTRSHEYVFFLTKSSKYYFAAHRIKEPATPVRRVVTGKTGSLGQCLGMGRKPSGNAIPGSVIVTGDTRNKRSVWRIPSQPYKGAHFATFPEKLVEPCILAGSPKGGVILDPFVGSGTTAVVALRHGRKFVGCELNKEYVKLAKRRIWESVLK